MRSPDVDGILINHGPTLEARYGAQPRSDALCHHRVLAHACDPQFLPEGVGIWRTFGGKDSSLVAEGAGKRLATLGRGAEDIHDDGS